MGDGLSHRRSRNARGDGGQSGGGAAGLRFGARLLGLSDARSGDLRHDRAPAATEGDSGRCAALLTQLLEPVCGAGAGPAAARLTAEFGPLPAILAAGRAPLQRCLAGEPQAADFILLLRSAFLHSLRRDLAAGPVIATSAALTDYLHAAMAHRAEEQLRILFLNARNRLIRDEAMAAGGALRVTVSPRAIVKRALELGATALILVHNHPSGDPEPSEEDVDTTRRLAAAAAALELEVHDHIIVARSGWTSLRALGLI